MNPQKRMAKLVSQLASDPSYAVGARRFPGRVTDSDAEAIAEAIAEEFDRGAAARSELAEEAGLRIACRSGCNGCCEVMVMTYRPEVLAIARFLSHPDNAAARERFLAAYSAWRDAVGDTPERLTELFVRGAQKEYDDLHQAHFRKRVLCAFNHEGRCSIYPVRPISCRNALALDTSDHCCADPPGGKPAATVSFVPLDEFLRRSLRLLRAAHNAGPSPRHHQESVCAATHRLLTGAA